MTHRTLTPQDPAASHRRESLVGWTGYTDPALLEEKNHMNAAQPLAMPSPPRPYPYREKNGPRFKQLMTWSDHETFPVQLDRQCSRFAPS